MPYVPTATIIEAAAAAGRGVGAFNVVHLEHAEAHVAGAQLAGAPVILQISENAVRWHGRLEPIALATMAVARAATVDVGVHLDHATQPELVAEAIELGLGSVMYDGSKLDWEDNLSSTRAIVDEASGRDVWVEAELGEVGGKGGVHVPGVRTDPEEARQFVAATGVDALAVAVGSSHAMTTRTTALDLELVRDLREAVPVPLVLHGSSGVPDDQLSRAVASGLTKVNLATLLNVVFTRSIRTTLEEQPELVDTRRYLGPAREAVSEEVARLLQVIRATHDHAS